MKKSFKKLLGIVAALIVLVVLVSVFTGQGLEESIGTVAEITGLSDSVSSDNTGKQIEDTNTEHESAAEAEDGQTAAPAEEAPGEETAQETGAAAEAQAEEPAASAIAEDGVYTTKEDVALYIYTYGHLPSNFITKEEAEAAGWSGGGLDRYCPGMCIGGNRFGNREGLLPAAKGRTYTECDINTLGARSRGAERIVFSNDGLIYYTGDHYESFELLYGEP